MPRRPAQVAKLRKRMRQCTAAGATKAERDRWTWIKTDGVCVCCAKLPDPLESPVAEIHHLLEGGIRRGHRFTIGLCLWHHKGQLWDGTLTPAQALQRLGPNVTMTRAFNDFFGSDDVLLWDQDEQLPSRLRIAA